MGKRVIVGLSGGVDSSVAALCLKKQGYAVEGLFMKNWEEEDTESYCAAAQDIAIAESVCNQLDIPLQVVNFSRLYWDRVFEQFLAEHQSNRTPNPDILCNQEIKFKAFLEHALSLGADYIATGHYADKRVSEGGQHQLLKATDLEKDQSYFLYTLTQKALSHTLFPLSTLCKKEVRQIASQEGFVNAEKKDSTGICFIGERHFQKFLSQYLPAQPGDIETPENLRVGEHQGLMFYTLGQRQGLRIGGKASAESAPWYVVGKDIQRNVLIVAQGEHHPLLYQTNLTAKNCHWIQGSPAETEFRCSAKIRYRQSDQACSVKLQGSDECQVQFDCAQRAITPGQSIVFYKNNVCLGGGVIQ